MTRTKDTVYILLALAILGSIGGYVVATRGFRNNNPGNLKASFPWKGMTGQDKDGYAIFSSVEFGVRALGRDLTSKINRGLNTVRKILTVYAPASENPTEAYIQTVARWMGLSPDQALTTAHVPQLVAGIAKFENGQPVPEATIRAGLAIP